MLFPYLLIKSCSINHSTLEAGPTIHVLPQLWQKNLPPHMAKKLDSGTPQRQG
jgi:hypothetical protein